MKHGTVKWFSWMKGSGFIMDGSEQEYFFMVKTPAGSDSFNIGEKVSFELADGNRGVIAVNVKAL